MHEWRECTSKGVDRSYDSMQSHALSIFMQDTQTVTFWLRGVMDFASRKAGDQAMCPHVTHTDGHLFGVSWQL